MTLARAVSRRISGGRLSQDQIRALRDEMDDLRAEVDSMRGRLGQVDEMQSRLDFAERVLAAGRDKSVLPGGR